MICVRVPAASPCPPHQTTSLRPLRTTSLRPRSIVPSVCRARHTREGERGGMRRSQRQSCDAGMTSTSMRSSQENQAGPQGVPGLSRSNRCTATGAPPPRSASVVAAPPRSASLRATSPRSASLRTTSPRSASVRAPPPRSASFVAAPPRSASRRDEEGTLSFNASHSTTRKDSSRAASIGRPAKASAPLQRSARVAPFAQGTSSEAAASSTKRVATPLALSSTGKSGAVRPHTAREPARLRHVTRPTPRSSAREGPRANPSALEVINVRRGVLGAQPEKPKPIAQQSAKSTGYCDHTGKADSSSASAKGARSLSRHNDEDVLDEDDDDDSRSAPLMRITNPVARAHWIEFFAGIDRFKLQQAREEAERKENEAAEREVVDSHSYEMEQMSPKKVCVALPELPQASKDKNETGVDSKFPVLSMALRVSTSGTSKIGAVPFEDQNLSARGGPSPSVSPSRLIPGMLRSHKVAPMPASITASSRGLSSFGADSDDEDSDGTVDPDDLLELPADGSPFIKVYEQPINKRSWSEWTKLTSILRGSSRS